MDSLTVEFCREKYLIVPADSPIVGEGGQTAIDGSLSALG